MPTMNTLHPSSSASTRPSRLAQLATVALLLAGVAAGAMAQAYKVVGPDGKVTYTDKPPTASAIKAPGPGGDTPSAAGGFPYETRQAMAKYPVTLYAAKNCGPCDNARQALRQRGVPFNEYSIGTDADMNALQARFGEPTAPVITIGGQTLKGYSASNVASYLDAAGYPAQAHLTGYSWPAATPLAPLRAAAAAPAPAPVASTPSPAPKPQNSGGIQF